MAPPREPRYGFHTCGSAASLTSSAASGLSAVLSCSGVDSGSGWTMRAKINSRPAVMRLDLL